METEIKLSVKPAIPQGPIEFFGKLMAARTLGGHTLGQITPVEIRDIYWDTPDGALAAAGAGLRLRLFGDKPLVTLKVKRTAAEGGITERDEWEEDLTQAALDRVTTRLGRPPVKLRDFAGARPCGGLVPVLKIGTMRVFRPVGRIAELALDVVKYPEFQGDGMGYFDIEVESKGATKEQLQAMAREMIGLGRGYVAPSTESKLERGLRLSRNVR